MCSLLIFSKEHGKIYIKKNAEKGVSILSTNAMFLSPLSLNIDMH